MDQATQRKIVGAQLRTTMTFAAGLIGALTIGLPASRAARTPVPDGFITLEAASSAEHGAQLASLGGTEVGSAGKKDRSGLSVGTIRWAASPSCLDGRLREVIN